MSIKGDKHPPDGRAARHDRTVRGRAGPPSPPDGHRNVSYRTSSYGYDIRCAPEFKVFTNIYSTVVDPKAPPDFCFAVWLACCSRRGSTALSEGSRTR